MIARADRTVSTRAVSGASSPPWFASLPGEKRVELRRLFGVQRWKSIIVVPFLALWLGGGAIAVGLEQWHLKLMGYVTAGVALHTLGILMHEAVHGNLFRHRAADRCAAFLLGAPVLVSGAAYRITHLLHHRYNRGPRDPDEFGNYIRNPKLLSLAFYVWGVLGMFVFLVHVPINALRNGTRRERVIVVTQYVVLAALYACAFALALHLDAADVLVHAWLLPLLFAFLIINIRGWSEHMLTFPGHPLTDTRTIISNRVVSFLLCNLNYHLEHHLFPGIPWYHLPRVHKQLREEFRVAGAFVYRSYVRFVWDAVWAGVHGRAPAMGREAT